MARYSKPSHFATDRAALSADDLEASAKQLLEKVAPGVFDTPQPLPVEKLVAFAKREHGLEFKVERLTSTSPGMQPLGAFQIDPPLIVLDESVAGTRRELFTFAHEFGHFVLHRGVRISKEDYEYRDAEFDLATGKKHLKTERDWIEWQANQFGASLVMPRKPLMLAVLQVQHDLDLSNRGRIYLDLQPCNQNAYAVVLRKLERVFNVTPSVIEYRLKDCGILHDRRLESTAHITRFLREVPAKPPKGETRRSSSSPVGVARPPKP